MAIKTSIKWGRPGVSLTAEELTATHEKFESMEYVFTTVMPDDEGYITREWRTEQDATAYIDLVNTFDPPPVSAKVIVE
jgi:hypothetical protein